MLRSCRFVGPPMKVNRTNCQSPEVRVPPPNSTAGEMNRGVSSMPTLLSCFWMISYVSARSGLPDVVVKANESLPTFGQLKMLEFPALGLSGPPVHPFFFSRAMAFFWLNFHFDTASCPARTACRCCSEEPGGPWPTDEAGLDVQHVADLCPVDALDDRLADVLQLQRRMGLRTLLEVDVLPRVAGAGLHLEALVLVEVDDLDLGRGSMTSPSPLFSAWNCEGPAR